MAHDIMDRIADAVEQNLAPSLGRIILLLIEIEHLTQIIVIHDPERHAWNDILKVDEAEGVIPKSLVKAAAKLEVAYPRLPVGVKSIDRLCFFEAQFGCS